MIDHIIRSEAACLEHSTVELSQIAGEAWSKLSQACNKGELGRSGRGSMWGLEASVFIASVAEAASESFGLRVIGALRGRNPQTSSWTSGELSGKQFHKRSRKYCGGAVGIWSEGAKAIQCFSSVKGSSSSGSRV